MAAPSALKTDYFSFLGLPRKLRIDMNDLEQRYRALSRQFHPDYFYNAPPAERRAALEKSSYLNDAYRALKNPVSRVEYLLRVEGVMTSNDSVESRHHPGFSRAAAPPAGLLEEVFALNEELEEIREARSAGATPEALKPRLERARQPIEAKRREHETQLEELSAKWDAAVDAKAPEPERRAILSALQERFLERNYINNLLGGIERELTQ